MDDEQEQMIAEMQKKYSESQKQLIEQLGIQIPEGVSDEYVRQIISQQIQDKKMANAAVLEATLAEFKRVEFELVLAGADPAEIEATKAEFEASKAELEAAHAELVTALSEGEAALIESLEAQAEYKAAKVASEAAQVEYDKASAEYEAALAEYEAVLAELGDVSEFDEEAMKAFIAANSVPLKYTRFLPIGALFIGTCGEPYETLAITSDSEDVAFVLEEGWRIGLRIKSREDGLEMLNSLLAGCHAVKFKKTHEALKAGNFDGVDEKDILGYSLCIGGITEVLNLPKSLVDNCETLLALDLEYIGCLARLFVKIGYLSEDEAWDWIKKAAAETKKHFKSWDEYIVSVLLGRCFFMGVDQEPYSVAYDLLIENRPFLDSRPISDL